MYVESIEVAQILLHCFEHASWYCPSIAVADNNMCCICVGCRILRSPVSADAPAASLKRAECRSVIFLSFWGSADSLLEYLLTAWGSGLRHGICGGLQLNNSDKPETWVVLITSLQKPSKTSKAFSNCNMLICSTVSSRVACGGIFSQRMYSNIRPAFHEHLYN